ncbi:MAG TPA: DNA polymerase III subunit beta [Polyangiaceae bacterium]|jgi:DNA polymerase-3 subunit beta|nr:DNA polymerase III subunit beta [Polyangiaceae bacterium]
MHVVVAKKDLLRVLARCQGVADKKSTMPVLGNVLLEVSGTDQLRLAATDLYLAVSGKIPAKVESGGAIALGARDLFERVKMMPDGQISIVTSGGAATTIRAVGASRRFTLHGIPGEEFPSLPQPEETQAPLSLAIATVSSLIAGTYFSISTDETRLHLNSALFEWDGDRVRMVTTDGHRLSKMEAVLPGKHASATMLIPLKGVLELKRLCDEALSEDKADSSGAAHEIRITQSGPNAFFQLAGFQFSVKLVDAQFPPYQQVIPEHSEQRVRAPRLALADALRAVSVAASDRTGGIKLTLSGGKMRFESESPDSGEGFDEVGVDYNGPELTVGFNARYFLDVLSAMDGDEIELAVSGELDPAVVRPAKETAGSYLSVIMPMRI